MSIQFDDIDLFFAKGEKILNAPGYIPILSSLTGAIRFTAGKVMASVAIIGAVGFLIASIFNQAYMAHAGRCGSHILHGMANTLRGLIEMIPLINLMTIPYDLSTRYTYSAEQIQLTPAVFQPAR